MNDARSVAHPRGSADASSKPARVVGVDGCKKGWVAATLVDAKLVELRVFADFAALIAAAGDARAIAVDIPIGLPERGRRAVDELARARLRPRQSTLFPMPAREVMAAPTYQAALTACAALGLPGLSKQAYALREKIFEVEAHRGRVPIFEIHPELCFQRMNSGTTLLSRKSSWAGAQERLGMLAQRGLVPPASFSGADRAAVDDVLDAIAAAWTADRIARGEAEVITDPAQTEIALYV